MAATVVVVESKGAAPTRGNGPRPSAGGKPKPFASAIVASTGAAAQAAAAADNLGQRAQRQFDRRGAGGRVVGVVEGKVVEKREINAEIQEEVRAQRSRFEPPQPVEPCEQPNKEAYQKQLEKLEPKHFAANLERINKSIEEKTKKRNELQQGRNAARQEVREIKRVRGEQIKIFNALKEEIDAAEKRSKMLKDAVNIQAEIEKIEDKLHHATISSMSVEKMLITTLSALKAKKTEVAVFNEGAAAAAAAVAPVDLAALKQQKKETGDKMKELRGKEDEKAALLEPIEQQEKLISEEIAASYTERDNLYKTRDDQKEQREALTADFRKKQRAWEQYEAYRQYCERNAERLAKIAAEKAARQAKYEAEKAERTKKHEDYIKRKEERERREKERAEQDRIYKEKKLAEELLKDPFEKQKNACDELLRYIQSFGFVASSASEAGAGAVLAGEPVGVTRKASDFKGGPAVKEFIKKEEDFGWGVKPVKKDKKKEAKKAAAPSQILLSHTPDVFAQFKVLDLLPPMQGDSLSASYEAVLAKQKYYETAPDPRKIAKSAAVEAKSDSDALADAPAVDAAACEEKDGEWTVIDASEADGAEKEEAAAAAAAAVAAPTNSDAAPAANPEIAETAAPVVEAPAPAPGRINTDFIHAQASIAEGGNEASIAVGGAEAETEAEAAP